MVVVAVLFRDVPTCWTLFECGIGAGINGSMELRPRSTLRTVLSSSSASGRLPIGFQQRPSGRPNAASGASTSLLFFFVASAFSDRSVALSRPVSRLVTGILPLFGVADPLERAERDVTGGATGTTGSEVRAVAGCVRSAGSAARALCSIRNGM